MVIVAAASDGEWQGFEDLFDSLETYLDCDYEVVIQDDASLDGLYHKLLKWGAWVSKNPYKMGYKGNDLTIRRAFYNAFTTIKSPLYLKMDPDSLLIGPGLDDALNKAFSGDHRIGILGNYLYDSLGEKRDFSFWQARMKQLQKELGIPLKKALDNGYAMGSGVMGGCYCLSHACVEAICRNRWLDDWQYTSYREDNALAEDHLMVMLAYAAGFNATDFGGADQPMAIKWQGLPMSPDQLVMQNKLVVHSIKYDGDEALAQRRFFLDQRMTYRQNQPFRI